MAKSNSPKGGSSMKVRSSMKGRKKEQKEMTKKRKKKYGAQA